jgi:cyclopropane fatty-acyl-phospholipid synthase-like methyltransferase
MAQSRAFGGGNASAVRWFAQQPHWWEDHYVQAVDNIVGFLAGDGLSVDGLRVLDLGCGDGIISLGLATRTSAHSVIGLDLQPVDTEFLYCLAAAHDVSIDHPQLTFGLSDQAGLPLPDSSIDVIVTWSVFEHVSDIPGLLAEIRRVLVTDGLLFIQIWPLYFSEHGSHLWPWFDESEIFPHLCLDDDDLASHVRRRAGSDDLARAMIDLYHSCNRITLDQLGANLHEAGFYISKLETDPVAVHIPPELQEMPLSLLTTSGIKLTAVNPSGPKASV